MRVARLLDQPDHAAVVAAIDTIFFEASRVTDFADARARSAFRARWLGVYIGDWPEHVLVARDGAIADCW